MKVTSTLVIAIIVNKRLWGLYSFHGYRQPIVPSARTRFLCEMASVMTSMVMESLTRMGDHKRLMDVEKTMHHLHSKNIVDFMDEHCEHLMKTLDVNLIAFKMEEKGTIRLYKDGLDGLSSATIVAFDQCDHHDAKMGTSNNSGDDGTSDGQIKWSTFNSLFDTYGQICHNYGVVFIDDQKSHPALTEAGLHTLAYFHLRGLAILLSRQPTIERVEWGGDPDKKLQPDGTLSPRNSFAAYMKNHLKKGRPWDSTDRRLVNRLAEQIERYRSHELFEEQTEAMQTLEEDKQKAIDDAKVNFDFFALMAHELRTPFHGILGSLEAMREDPALRDNELLRTAEHCGKNMIKILDDILLVAKGAYSLQLEEQTVNVEEFLRSALGDMTSYAYMEGVSVRVRKTDVFHENLSSDFSRIRQVLNNLISNAIKFSEDDIYVELLQRKSFAEVISVWKTYMNIYPEHRPLIKDLAAASSGVSEEGATEEDSSSDRSGTDGAKNCNNSDKTLWLIISVIDKGIGIKGEDLNRLGTAFTQLSKGRQRKYQGTGLGINICHMIVTAMEGKMVIFSAPGFGSCFTFGVPVKMMMPTPSSKRADNGLITRTNDNREDEKKRRIKQLRDEFEMLGLASRGLKILVVDDSSINRKLCGRKIRTWLPDVTIANCSSGKAAIEEYEYDHPIIMGIFLDFHMHGMDGDACARKIREFEGTHDGVARPVWITGYTADVLKDSTEALLNAGMDSVVPKPEPADAFETELRNMMHRFGNCANGSKGGHIQ